MGPDLHPGLVDHAPALLLEPVALEEVPVVVACEEAGLLALGTARGGEPRRQRLGARLRLRLLAEREPQASEHPGSTSASM